VKLSWAGLGKFFIPSQVSGVFGSFSASQYRHVCKSCLIMFNLLNALIPAATTSRMMRQGLALHFAMPLTAALLLLGGNAFADAYTIDATGVDWSRGENIWINGDGNPVQTYFTGVIDITLTDTDSNQQWNRDTLCVDLFTDIYIGQAYGTMVLHPSDVSGSNLPRVSWLVDNALLPTQNNSASSVLPSSDWVTSSAQGSGIQLAIWDIVHDNGDGLSAGRVQASSDPNNPTPQDVIDWVNTYETLSLNQSSDLSYIYENVSLSDDTPAQRLAGPEFADNGPAPVPEPSTCQFMLVSLAGWIGLWFSRRR
jgi:hypothetical protein